MCYKSSIAAKINKNKSMLQVVFLVFRRQILCVFMLFVPSWQLRNRDRVDRTLLALPPEVNKKQQKESQAKPIKHRIKIID